MPILTTGTGIIRPIIVGVKPVGFSPSNLAAPPIVTPPSGLGFDYATARPGVPANNEQFEYFGGARDWDWNFIHPTQGFGSIRWQPTWKRADGFYGSWEPAEGEIFRIQRKGASGAAARTLVLTCGPNPAAVPVGDPVVLWDLDFYNGHVHKTVFSRNLLGYNLPLLQKMTVTASAGSEPYNSEGRRIIEIDAGQDLPAIDFTPDTFSSGGTWQKMRCRHWSFYKNNATKEMRHPLGWFTHNTMELSLPNGGHIMLGGLQGQPTWYDWTADYQNFGASLTEELWRMECEGLAYHMGASNPRMLAVELENEPTREWGTTADGVGYGDLLPDVWYGIARQVWGQERTLVVKANGNGDLGHMRDYFNFRCPAGENAHLVTHNYDGQADGPGGYKINWADFSQTDYYAGEIAKKITELGYKGGGTTELGVEPVEWWSDWSLPNGEGIIYVSDDERSRRYGRITTSLTNKGLYNYIWGSAGDDVNCTGLYNIDGHVIQAYQPQFRQYASRAGLVSS